METINEEVEEVKNEEGTEEYSNEVIEEGTKQEDKEAEARQNGLLSPSGEAPKIEEAEAEPKPKAKPKKQARSVKVVELVACPDCDKKMLPKSLRHSHPRNCKGQPTETRPINKQQNSYGSKLREQMRKEIEEEMKVGYQHVQQRRAVTYVHLLRLRRTATAVTPLGHEHVCHSKSLTQTQRQVAGIDCNASELHASRTVCFSARISSEMTCSVKVEQW